MVTHKLTRTANFMHLQINTCHSHSPAMVTCTPKTQLHLTPKDSSYSLEIYTHSSRSDMWTRPISLDTK
jgi:hypothetical protein